MPLKLFIFTLLFVAISGSIGSWLIPTRLLYAFSFFIYGNLGKMVLLSIVLFFLIVKDKLETLKNPTWQGINSIFLLLALISSGLFMYLATNLLGYSSFVSNLSLSIFSHLTLVSIPLFLFLGIFGLKFFITFIKAFSKEIFFCLLISLFLDFGIFQVWKLWPFFSGGVLYSVRFLLSLSFSDVIFSPPYTLTLNNFSVAIQQACSGLDSLFMFTALYTLIGFTEQKTLSFRKYLSLFPLALLGMYIVNILRVYLLILIGATISPTLALKLFHTYAGMILFLLYFGLFWRLSYKFLQKGKSAK